MKERIANVIFIMADRLYALGEHIDPEQTQHLRWIDQFLAFDSSVTVEQAAANLELLRGELSRPHDSL